VESIDKEKQRLFEAGNAAFFAFMKANRLVKESDSLENKAEYEAKKAQFIKDGGAFDAVRYKNG